MKAIIELAGMGIYDSVNTIQCPIMKIKSINFSEDFPYTLCLTHFLVKRSNGYEKITINSKNFSPTKLCFLNAHKVILGQEGIVLSEKDDNVSISCMGIYLHETQWKPVFCFLDRNKKSFTVRLVEKYSIPYAKVCFASLDIEAGLNEYITTSFVETCSFLAHEEYQDDDFIDVEKLQNYLDFIDFDDIKKRKHDYRKFIMEGNESGFEHTIILKLNDGDYTIIPSLFGGVISEKSPLRKTKNVKRESIKLNDLHCGIMKKLMIFLLDNKLPKFQDIIDNPEFVEYSQHIYLSLNYLGIEIYGIFFEGLFRSLIY